MQTQLITLQGASSSRSKENLEAQARAKQRLNFRRRSFYCFIAEERTSSQIVGCVALSLARPEAVLPPPFPTMARLRCYISNMAVAPSHRQQGIATQMLHRCERIARLWGQSSVWLHVELQNKDAVSLYKGLGYKQVPWWGSSALPWKGKKKQILLVKELRPLPKRKYVYLKLDSSSSSSSGSEDEVGIPDVAPGAGENKNKSGVFVWNVNEGEGEEEEESGGSGDVS